MGVAIRRHFDFDRRHALSGRSQFACVERTWWKCACVLFAASRHYSNLKRRTSALFNSDIPQIMVENPSVTDKQNGTTITEDEAALYDRQIRLWGLDAQKR